MFVGNLAWSVDDSQLGQVFQQHGKVLSARVIHDRDTGRSRGFGFVEMDVADVASLLRLTDGLEIAGRPVRVNEAEDKGGSRSGSRRDGGGFSDGRHP